MNPVTVIDVVLKPSGWWIITDSSRVQYATKDLLRVVQAQRYCARLTRVTIRSVAGEGFYYRTIKDMDPVETTEAA